MRSIHKKFFYLLSGLFLVYLIIFYIPVINKEGEIKKKRHKLEMVIGWEYGVNRNISYYITDYKSTSKMIPSTFCDKNTVLIVMVCSSPGNLLARKTIRETWGNNNELGRNVSLYFLLGESANLTMQYVVSLERDKYKDIIQEQFLDTYNNLTLKSVIMLKLVSQYCLNSTKYLMKIDDDMFLNTKSLVEMLENRPSSTDLLVGKLICGAKPIRDTNSKWFSPHYMYGPDLYPNYLSGTGYVMSVDVAVKLFKTTLETPIFHLEDVYLSGICATKVQINPTNDARFTFNELTHEPCLVKHLYTAHHFNTTYMKEMYRLIHSSDLKCSNNTETNHWVAANIRKRDPYFRNVNCEKNVHNRNDIRNS